MDGGRSYRTGLFRLRSIDLLTDIVCIALNVSFLLSGTNMGSNGGCKICATFIVVVDPR